MGKKKNVDMSAEMPAETKSSKKKMTIWEDLYTDLSPRIASALREARVKPDQLTIMQDGEITAIEGIGEVGLEEIRAAYAPEVTLEVKEESAPVGSEESAEQASTIRPANKRHDFRGGKAIKAAKSKVDRTKSYEVNKAVQLVKATNITKFDAALTLHLNLKDKMSRVEVTFPHMAGAAKRIAIASEEILAELEKGIINFDILLTTPAMMPRLAKYARVLGPKGLMPSPKSGTITPDPESKKKEFAGGKTVVKGEAKFPLMHVTIGKVSQKDEELVANIMAILEAVKPKNINKAVLASTMSPGVKLLLTQ